ncbi:two-component sensor histidine kinase [Nonomuraea phyllanthi]|uniref:histidine kinase n=1 Tax=Nonomuraea phyllanthi TaxID=2219224 RepID=UPI001293047F|nr:histidine kinase [Nonomuraea phyllanthi]QFY10451.1 two-component sensor histidine kinase [Nonomuraea phyllanthi]
MRVHALVTPLISGVTYRRGVHLLLGGVLLLPYLIIGYTIVRVVTVPATPRVLIPLLALAVLVGCVPPFLRGTRSLEIAAARSLLGVPLPDPPATTGQATGQEAREKRETRETRVRGALWFAVHLVIGGVVGLLLAVPVVLGVIFIAQWFGVDAELMAGLRVGPLNEHDTGWLALVGVVLLIGVLYTVAGLGALAAVMAPVLLGPSAAERIATLEAHATRLAERNRLARELHDSIGHALTVTTVQAAAALEVLDTDPRFARRALTAIEDVGRAAADDLDRVLGMLREGGPADRSPRRGLADLDKLLAQSRGTGVDVHVETEGAVGSLPAPVSREGYRIIQETLTNALRHAGPVPVTLRVAVHGGSLAIDVANPVTGSTPRHTGGRGLIGMRERVDLLGGSMTAGLEEGQWKVSVRLPKGRPS